MDLVGVLLGIVLGIINIKIFVSWMLNPNTPFLSKTYMAYAALAVLIPLFVDSILLFKLCVVYPSHRTPRQLLAIIFIPVIIFKLFRIPFRQEAILLNIKNYAPWVKIEWFMQFFDNCYASGWFLWRIGIRVSDTKMRDRRAVNPLKQLFILGFSSFVFPSIIQKQCHMLTLISVYTFLTNVYVEIIGVLLATLWAFNRGSSRDRHNNQTSSQSIQPPSVLAFRGSASSPSSNGTSGHGNPVTIGLHSISGIVEVDSSQVLSEEKIGNGRPLLSLTS